MDISTTMPSGAVPMRGKSAEATGQLAKMAVAMAREAQVDLPKSAQGIAASAIARGSDIESVVASLISADAPTDDDGTIDEPATTPVVEGPGTGETEGAQALETPDVVTTSLDDSPDLPDDVAGREPGGAAELPDVPAANTVPVRTIGATMAEEVARDALEMLFGQTRDSSSG